MAGLRAEVVRALQPGRVTISVPASAWKRFQKTMEEVRKEIDAPQDGKVSDAWERIKLDALSAAFTMNAVALEVE